MRVFLLNVGTNASDGFAGPIFDDGTFEFVPIREGDRSLDTLPGVVTYRDLRSHYETGDDLLRYIPDNRRDNACHHDPEFETLTYGDDVRSGRAANLRHAERGDVLVFLARLQRWTDSQRTQEFGFYLTGGLHIEHVVANVSEQAATVRIARNAHVIRARASGDWDKWGGFQVFAGSERSRRFHQAVPVTRSLCDKVFRDKNGAPWLWPAHRSDLSVIGSYTRTCRCVFDTNDSEQAGRVGVLRSWIARHSGEHDAELLASDGGEVMP